MMPHTDPLHKVTIIPRGRALGITMQLPTEDKHTYRKSFVESQIAVLMGGRVAEELTQSDITTGAGNDIERATDLARQMVCDWGMSKLGPLSFGQRDEPVFLGREINQPSNYSGETAVRIDKEVARFVQEGYEQARKILTEHDEVLEALARELLERESLEGREVYELIRELTGLDVAPKVERLEPRTPAGTDEEAAQPGRDKEKEEREDASPGSLPSAPSPAPT